MKHLFERTSSAFVFRVLRPGFPANVIHVSANTGPGSRSPILLLSILVIEMMPPAVEDKKIRRHSLLKQPKSMLASNARLFLRIAQERCCESCSLGRSVLFQD